jgi:hypothetical protein
MINQGRHAKTSKKPSSASGNFRKIVGNLLFQLRGFYFPNMRTFWLKICWWKSFNFLNQKYQICSSKHI